MGSISDEHVERRAARLLHQRDIEVALLGVALDRRLGERAQSGAPEKALHRRVGRADARSLPLFPQVRLAGGNALHEQSEPARRRERLRPFIDEASLDEALGHELAQILRRPRLHAGRDFLGEQLKQKVGHGGVIELPEGRARRSGSYFLSPPPACGGRKRQPPKHGRCKHAEWRLRAGGSPHAPPPAVASHASPHALASSRTRRI